MSGISVWQLFIIIPIFVCYLLPTIIVLRNGHKNKLLIILLNFTAGWTLFGWVVALIWAIKLPIINNISSADEIEKLHNLKEKGIITESDFNRQKKDLIG
jgi:hypothetical protein